MCDWRQVVAADQLVAASFQRECYTFNPWDPKFKLPPAHLAHLRKFGPKTAIVQNAVRNCVSDEHYVPTVLAVNGLDDEVSHRQSLIMSFPPS